MTLRVFSNINNSVILWVWLWTKNGACSVATQAYPGWPYRPSSRMGQDWKGIRLKKDQAEKGSGWMGPFTCCRSNQGQEAAGTHWKRCCVVAWLSRDKQQVPGAVYPQRLIRAAGVTSCLRLSRCPHVDTHQALCSIKNRGKKAIIYQDGLSCACLGCPWQRESGKYCFYSCLTHWTCAEWTWHRDQHGTFTLWGITKIPAHSLYTWNPKHSKSSKVNVSKGKRRIWENTLSKRTVILTRAAERWRKRAKLRKSILGFYGSW